MKAIAEIGLSKSIKFFFATIFDLLFSIMIFPPLRVLLLRVVGAKIGKNVVIHSIRFINLYRGSFRNLTIGDNCFLGGEVLLDLADKISLKNHVTLAERVNVLTHVNVGYHDHPLQKYFPAFTKPTKFENGVFAGVNSTILAGVQLKEGVFVAAGSVVTESVDPMMLVGGVPAKIIRKLN